MAYFPFRATSNTVLNVTVTGTSVAYEFPTNAGDKYTGSPNTLSGTTILFQNLGASPVYFAWGDKDTVATVPTFNGTNGQHVVPNGAIMVLSRPQSDNFPSGVTHIAFIRDAADSNVRISVALGEGE